LPDSYFMRNVLVLHLSEKIIITLGSLKSNIDWYFVTVCISVVLNNFIKNWLTGISDDLRLVLFGGRSHII